ncbi:hypothetical protein ERJ75_001373000 [Trypanosoma vivax]|nr:hypothetical protein ERJ75_001373000 [Trypanosoma vivax]
MRTASLVAALLARALGTRTAHAADAADLKKADATALCDLDQRLSLARVVLTETSTRIGTRSSAGEHIGQRGGNGSSNGGSARCQRNGARAQEGGGGFGREAGSHRRTGKRVVAQDSMKHGTAEMVSTLKSMVETLSSVTTRPTNASAGKSCLVGDFDVTSAGGVSKHRRAALKHACADTSERAEKDAKTLADKLEKGIEIVTKTNIGAARTAHAEDMRLARESRKKRKAAERSERRANKWKHKSETDTGEANTVVNACSAGEVAQHKKGAQARHTQGTSRNRERNRRTHSARGTIEKENFRRSNRTKR